MKKWIYRHGELIGVASLWLWCTGFFAWWWWSIWATHHHVWEKVVLAPLPIIWVGGFAYGVYKVRTA